MTTEAGTRGKGLLPYVPKLLLRWSPTGDDSRHMQVTGTLAFVDISGFTQLTERLARKGKVGAEEMSDVLSATFSGLLTDARADGADLVKWGGDAVLLLFRGHDHAVRAARASHRMRATLRALSRGGTTAATGRLRMSVGVHSGTFDFFLVGDRSLHRELLVCGPGASITAETEAAAGAGQIGFSAAAAALVPGRLLGGPLRDGRLLRSAPVLDDVAPSTYDDLAVDPAEALPTGIREHVLSGGSDPEHRLITVAFVQFSGTDALLGAAGPVALAGALDHVVRSVQRACADHDVTFFETDINRDGGKIMLTAGAPRASDHDEERMLRVARVILDEAGELPLRIGINRGHVFAGDFGPEFRRTYSVKGDAVNLAARVMGQAAAGQALATTEVVEQSRTLFHTKALAPFMVKGKSRPVHAAAIGDIVGLRGERRRLVPLIGRREEMAVLREGLDGVRRGEARLVDLVGEPGLGKSRLVEELLDETPDLRVLQLACEDYESSTAYFSFRGALRDALDVDPGATGDAAVHQLADRVALIAPHLLKWLPLLGIVADLPVPPTQETLELGEQFRKSRLEAVTVEVLQAALTDPTVLVVEDAHLMDDASADLLRLLVDGLGSQAWLLLVTRREVEDGFDPGAGPRVSTLHLGPLDPAAALTFVQTALDDHPLTASAIDTLAGRSGGNPLFLEALVVEAGRSGSLTELPESVEGLVTSGIDRLDPQSRKMLRYAAVLGATVDEAILEVLLEDGAGVRLADGLAEFLVRERPGRLRFRNGLLRDVAYEGLPFSRRRLLHERVAETIESSSSTPEDQSELLSQHYFAAGKQAKAWRYSVLAGERALSKFAHRDAVDFLARAARSAPRAGQVETGELGRVLELLADSRFLIGLTQEAADTYGQARRQLAGDPVRLAAIIEKEARIEHRHRKYTQAMRRISRGLHALDGVPGRPAGVARSLLARRYAFSRFNQGRIDEALHWANVAATSAEDAVDKDALAQAYEMLNAIHAGSGREEPLPYGRLALQAYRELGNLPRQGHCLNNLAVQAFTDGRWSEALVDYDKATDIFRRIGDTASEGNALYNRCELLVRQGREEEAGGLLPDVLRIARAVEDDELVALALREQGRVRAAEGDVEGAVRVLHDVRDRFILLDEPSEVTITDLARAEVLLAAGRLEEVHEVLDELTSAADPGADALTVSGHRLVGLLHAAEGSHVEARLLLSRGLELAEQETDRYEAGLLLRALADVAEAEGGADARDLRGRAEEILEPMGMVRLSPRSPARRR